jgi:hypothetical protein
MGEGVVVWLGLLLLLQENPTPAGKEPHGTPNATFLDPLRGSLRTQFRYRATSGDSDTDLYEFLSLSYGDPDRDSVTAALSARLAEDLDGDKNVRGFYPFGSVDDKYSSWAASRLYTAYLDVRNDSKTLFLRGGRQILESFPEAVAMDGATFGYLPTSDLSFMVFGGIPVNLFESSPSGDAMYGAAAEWVPDPERRGRYRVEYLHIRDDNVYGLHKDDLVGLSLDEGLGDFHVHARYTLLEGESRDVVARLSGAVPDAGFLFRLQGTYVFHRIEALSYPLDPYSSFLMDLQPYFDVVFSVSKSFGAVILDASYTSRQLVRSGTESAYNHEFDRFEIAPQIRPIDELSLRFSADFWNSSGSDFWTTGGDLAWTVHPDIVLSVGSSYALYSIDVFTGEERERVRTYSVGVKWRVSKGSSIDARFLFEETSIGDFRTLEVGFRHAF